MPRQCPDRSTFRAGRNLPDKEFRYLRTVIVTAAVYRGFSSDLAALPLTFRHWAGLSPYTSTLCVFAGTGVFGKQSPGPALCDPLELQEQVPSPYRGAPSPEVTGPICRVPWHGFSRPPWYALPAHLCRFAVRSRRPSLEAFLGSPGSIRSGSAETSPSPSPLGQRPHGFACGASLPAWRATCTPGPTSLRPPITQTVRRGTGFSTRCPSASALACALGPPHPQLISIAAEPLGIRWEGFSPSSRYSCRHSHSAPLQVTFQFPFSADADAPLPRTLLACIRSVGAGLSPGGLSAPRRIDQ
jgi:hypothetical protein